MIRTSVKGIMSVQEGVCRPGGGRDVLRGSVEAGANEPPPYPRRSDETPRQRRGSGGVHSRRHFHFQNKHVFCALLMQTVRLKASLAVMPSSLNSAKARPKNKQKQQKKKKARKSTELFKVRPPAFLSSESSLRFVLGFFGVFFFLL